MAKLSLKKASTDVTVYVFIQDSTSTSGAGKTGLAYNTSGLACYYVRQRGSATQLELATLAAVDSAHADGGFVEVSSANMPGVYRLDLSDAVCADNSHYALVMLKGATGMAPLLLEIQLTNFDLNDADPDVNVTQIAGSAVSTTTAQIGVNVVQVSGDGPAADNLETAFDGGTYNVGGGAVVAASVTGAVGSVTGAVGSVTGAVGSVTGNVGGNVTGSVGSVATGGIVAASFASGAITADAIAADAIGASELAAGAATEIATAVWASADRQLTALDEDVTTIDINATAVGSVVGAVGSVTGNVGGNVTGSVGSVAAGGITATSIATGAIDADALAADAVTEIWAGSTAPSAATIADAVWDEAATGHTDAGKAGAQLWTDIDAILVDTAEIGTAGAGLTALPWNSAWDAEVESEATDALNAYDPPTNAEMEARTLPAASYFDPAADTVANVTTVATVTNGVGLANDAITAATFDETTAFPLKSADTGSTAVARTGADSDTLETLSDQLDAVPTATENADALLKRDWTEVSSEAARSVLNALRFLRNKWSVSGSTLTVTKEDDSTTAWTAAVTGSEGATPISAVDPN